MIKTFKNDENIPIDYSQTQVFLKMIANFVKTLKSNVDFRISLILVGQMSNHMMKNPFHIQKAWNQLKMETLISLLRLILNLLVMKIGPATVQCGPRCKSKFISLKIISFIYFSNCFISADNFTGIPKISSQKSSSRTGENELEWNLKFSLINITCFRKQVTQSSVKKSIQLWMTFLQVLTRNLHLLQK